MSGEYHSHILYLQRESLSEDEYWKIRKYSWNRQCLEQYVSEAQCRLLSSDFKLFNNPIPCWTLVP